jgi:hypothetical protein
MPPHHRRAPERLGVVDQLAPDDDAVDDLEQFRGGHATQAGHRHLPVDDRADGVPVDELAANSEARHRVTRRLRHRAVALGGVEARDGTGELEVVGEWDVAEVALLLLPGLVVEGNGLERRHLRPHIRSVSASIHIDTRTDRN